MMLTKDQWAKIAEAEAAAHYGRKYAKAFMFRRFLAGPAGVLVLAGGLGLGAYLAWTHIHLPSASRGHLPGVFWVAVILLGIGTFIAFRPGRLVPAATIIVRAAVFSLLWLGLATYGVTILI